MRRDPQTGEKPAVFVSVFLIIFIFLYTYHPQETTTNTSSNTITHAIRRAPYKTMDFRVSFLSDGMNSSLHVLYDGVVTDNKPYTFLLIHGGSQSQNASHWLPHFQFLSNKGSFFAVDLIGHGNSTHSSQQHPTIDEHATYLSTFIKTQINNEDSNKQIIIVARSYGGGVALSLVKKLEKDIKAMILIAPAIPKDLLKLSSTIKSKPILFFWDETDSVVKIDKYNMLEKTFKHSFLYKCKGTYDEKNSWKSHTPEIEFVHEFHEAINDFLANDNLLSSSKID